MTATLVLKETLLVTGLKRAAATLAGNQAAFGLLVDTTSCLLGSCNRKLVLDLCSTLKGPS